MQEITDMDENIKSELMKVMEKRRQETENTLRDLRKEINKTTAANARGQAP